MREYFSSELASTRLTWRPGERAGLYSCHTPRTLRRHFDWLAYMLATTHHETDRTFRPIEEYGRGRGHPYGQPDPQTGQTYYGRGFVQLTWKANYEAMGKRLKVDLVGHPELALELDVATQILFVGMREGRFTGKRLRDYFSARRRTTG